MSSRDETKGRHSITDRRLRPTEVQDGKTIKASVEDVELVTMILEDEAMSTLTQVEVTEAIQVLLDCPEGTAQGKASKSLLWMHREGLVEYRGQRSVPGHKPSNLWRLVEQAS